MAYDDGKSWQTAPFVLIGDRGVLKVKPGAVSLRTRVTDVNGNTGVQTRHSCVGIDWSPNQEDER